nr:putative ubiquitin carboxyl-terminal hydrolase [Thecaphora frezii]
MSADNAPIRWVPLESNPELFTTWSHNMGLDSARFAFHDILGLEPELLQMVPQPVEAVLFLYPITAQTEEARQQEDAAALEQQAAEAEGETLWFKQTIGNACGTIGLLHALSNTRALEAVREDSPLRRLLDQARPLVPAERAQLLASSKELESVHSATASAGQSAAPQSTDEVDLHFVCFVRDRQGELVELDGRRKGPLKRGVKVASQQELLSKAVEFVQQHYMTKNPDEVNFNLIALGPAADY